MEPLGYIPPAEAEASYYRQLSNTIAVPPSTWTNQPPRFPGRFNVFNADGSKTAYEFHIDGSQDAILFNAAGQEIEIDSFNSGGQLTGFDQFTYNGDGSCYEVGQSEYSASGAWMTNGTMSTGGGGYYFVDWELTGEDYEGEEEFSFFRSVISKGELVPMVGAPDLTPQSWCVERGVSRV